MIPVDREGVLNVGLELLSEFSARTNIRGRFVALYLGLRRMGSGIAPLGSAGATPTSDIEQFLDTLYTKTNRPPPLMVLTALFGQSTSPTAPWSTRTGATAPGNQYPTNTWRNNFGIQKGVGCPAEPGVIRNLLADPAIRLACPHMAVDPEGRNACSLANTVYRGDEHSIWLRQADGGYQVTDLNDPAVYRSYLQPTGQRIPIFPLTSALYSFAPAEVYPQRTTVGIPDFAHDFGFNLSDVQALFDCDPESEANALLLREVDEARLMAVPPALGAFDEVVLPGQPLPELAPAIELNTGVGAELAVAGELSAHGWEVVYRGNQRRFGYDLEAARDEIILRIEVKSSVGFTNPELSDAEWTAAQLHGDEFVLAVVDFYRSENQSIWYIRNPAANAVPATRTATLYRLPRGDIQPLSTDVEFL